MAVDFQAIRTENLDWLTSRGFDVAAWLPTLRSAIQGLRPTHEIAARLMALDVVFSWVSAPEAMVATEKLRNAAQHNDLERSMTAEELEMFRQDRPAAHHAHVDTVGWKLENMWGLAWMLGFEREPPFDGAMIDTETTRSIIYGMLPKLGEPVDVLVQRAKVRSFEEAVRLEDRFYCCHHAVRSAQLGGSTVPPGFHPIANGGVIHERRHALTWSLSPGVHWNKTDLST